MNKIARIIMMAFAWLCFVLGCIGVFVPVLPTTPLLLLATFLFARSSERCHDWICSTKVYKNYVGAFKEAGGMPVPAKIRMLTLSYAVLALSAFLVQKPFVWAILACVAAFLLWLVTCRIPTVNESRVKQVREAAKE
ncbi:MAG: YbaN family protein [Eggerthellaceae bacterium]|nr:YbaN family protein [Eggerthellaceae bacterium]